MSRSLTTAAVRSGIATDATHGAVAPPLCLSANFSFAGFDRPRMKAISASCGRHSSRIRRWQGWQRTSASAST